MNTWLAIFIGGGLGSLLRYFISSLSLKLLSSGFPWGTFISNMLACLVLAFSVVFFKDRFIDQPLWRFFIITGFCGGFSTFSTFSFENFELVRTDHAWLALTNVLVSVGIGLAIMIILFKDFDFNV